MECCETCRQRSPYRYCCNRANCKHCAVAGRGRNAGTGARSKGNDVSRAARFGLRCRVHTPGFVLRKSVVAAIRGCLGECRQAQAR